MPVEGSGNIFIFNEAGKLKSNSFTCVSALESQCEVPGHLVTDLAKVLGGQLAQVFVVNASSASHDHPAARVVGLNERCQIVPGVENKT